MAGGTFLDVRGALMLVTARFKSVAENEKDCGAI